MTFSSAMKKLSAKHVMLLAVLTVAVVSAAAYTNRASAASDMQAGNSLQGEIVAVANVNHIQTLTVRSDEIGRFPNDELNVFLNKNTTVKMCSVRGPAKDLKVGRDASIEYHELGGVPVADAVSEQC